MAKHETTADIIAAMRFDATTRDQFDSAYIVDFCDRLEAAHNRETVTGSNQLREALVKARRFVDSSPLVCIVDNTVTIARGELCAEIDAALAAPATAEKSSAVGDCAKLREALEQVQKKINYLIGNLTVSNSLVANRMEINGIINAALAAPTRNCDVIGNTGRALLVHGFPTKSNQWGEGEWLEFIDWLLAPATEQEGGNDENE